jgi:hypothetical protein
MWDHTKPDGCRVRPDAPVVGLDVDGTLGAYHDHFVWFASMYLERELVCDWSRTKGEFHEALGLDLDLYRQIKLAFRQSGMKRIMPTLNGSDVRTAVQGIRKVGIQIWIATTRPWLRLDNIDPDTRYWLRTRVGRVDGLIFGEEKYEDLQDLVGAERILGVVDDLPENITRAHELGLRCAMMTGEHNAWWRGDRGVKLNEPSDITITAMRWYEEHPGSKS